MVQMKQILAEYVPTRYKQLGTDEFTDTSFIMSIGSYALILCIYGISQYFLGLKSPRNSYIVTQEFVCLSIVGLNLIAMLFFRKDWAKRYMAIVLYLSASLAPVLIILGPVAAVIFNHPEVMFLVALAIVVVSFIMSVVAHSVIVYIAIKKENLEIRDRFTNYYFNIIGSLAILIMFISEAVNNIVMTYVGFMMTAIIFLYFAVFYLPKVLMYWWKPADTPNDGAQLIYGNALKIAKKGRKK